MPKVLALTRYDRLGASSRIRFLQFLPELAKRGLDVDVHYLLDDSYVARLYAEQRVRFSNVFRAYARRLQLMQKRHRYDLIWIEKEVFPWVPIGIEKAVLGGVPYVIDLDDAWFHRYDMSRSAIIRRICGGKIDSLMADSAAVIAGNDYLAERAVKSGARCVKVIQTVVDLDRYGPVEETPVSGPDEGEVIIGWIGTPLNVRYLYPLRDAFARVAADSRIKLAVIGAKVPAELAGLPVRSIAWSEATEIEEIGKLAIGIMPLDDTPWERGKCGFKLLQVMAAGRPVVASPVGVNQQIVRHGTNGFLASTVDEWTAALTRLVADPALRRTLGAEARRTVERSYSVAAVLGDLAALLHQAATARTAPTSRPEPTNAHCFDWTADAVRPACANGVSDHVSGGPRPSARWAAASRTIIHGADRDTRPPAPQVGRRRQR